MSQKSNNAIHAALTLLNQGNAALAINNLKALLSMDQTNPDVLQALGLCYLNTGDYAQAEYYFSNATCRNDKILAAWIYLGISQNQLGKNTEAITTYQRALRINASSIDALQNLALTYFNTRDINASVKTAKKALKVDNKSSKAHNILGLCYRNSNVEKAIYHFNQSIKLLPELYDGYHNLVDTYVMYQQYDKAIKTLTNVISKFPTNPVPCITLGKIYEKNNRLTDAIIHYKDATARHPDNISLQSSLARCLISQQNFEAGFNILNQLHEKHNQHPDVIEGLSDYYILLKDYNKTFELTDSFISNHNPASIPPGILRSHATACSHTDNINRGIDALESSLSVASEQYVREAIHYSLADLYDRNKSYDSAFLNYDTANKIKNEASDIDYYCNVVDDIIQTFNKDTISQLPHSSSVSNKPVFIVGMPRSGTSLVEQIISSHSDVHGAGEITSLWNIANDISGAMNLLDYCKNIRTIDDETINTYAARYLEEIEAISDGYKICTDKLPHNFMHIGLIELLFPGAHIVHCRRHPFDTCLSIYFKNFNDNHKYSRNLSELARFYQSYMALMEHWDKTSSLTIHTVDYEMLVNKPELYIKSMIDSVGLEWDEACLSHHKSDRKVMTPSHDQATKPIYQHAVYRWKNYQNHISPLSEVLGDPEQFCQ